MRDLQLFQMKPLSTIVDIGCPPPLDSTTILSRLPQKLFRRRQAPCVFSNRACWTWNQRSSGLILTGVMFCYCIFLCFHIVKPLMPIWHYCQFHLIRIKLDWLDPNLVLNISTYKEMTLVPRLTWDIRTLPP